MFIKLGLLKTLKKNLIHEQLKAATMAPAVTDFIAKSIPKICHGLSPQPRSSDTSPCSSPSPSPQVLPLARGSLSFTQGVAMACGFLASALKHWLLRPGGGEADVRLCGAKGRQTFNRKSSLINLHLPGVTNVYVSITFACFWGNHFQFLIEGDS